MSPRSTPSPAGLAGNNSALPLPAETAGAQAKLFLTKKELAAALPMAVRSIERLVSKGVIPAHLITPRMVRFRLPAVLAALDRYQTATLRK